LLCSRKHTQLRKLLFQKRKDAKLAQMARAKRLDNVRRRVLSDEEQAPLIAACPKKLR